MIAVWIPLMSTSVIAIIGSLVTFVSGPRELSDALDWVAWTAYAATVLVDVLAAWWGTAVIGFVLGAAWLWALWRKHRKGRKRAPRAYGAKSKALLAALVRKAREAAKPRQVLRPVPGGAS